MAKIIDGKAVAARLREKTTAEVKDFVAKTGVTPGLAVVLVGDDPASQVYVRNKGKACEAVGVRSIERRLPASTSQAELLSVVSELNADKNVHGILVQLPLPDHLNEDDVIASIDPAKDVDGFHPINVGKLASGLPALVPCTPQGSMILIKEVLSEMRGLKALVVGRSNIVGKPMAQLLLAEHCTVTIAHSRTRDLAAECAVADILVAAVGKPGIIKGGWVKPGAVVIDVGINRITGENGKSRLIGDVEFATAAERAGAITPVPGGVGPMTIACLLKNALQAAREQVRPDLA